MDYEYSVIGSIFCNADQFATTEESSEFVYNGYVFQLRKFAGRINICLHGPSCKTIPEADVATVCKFLSQKFSCAVSMRKGYEVYGNANVFNGGSDYEVIEEKWFSVEFDNGIQKKR